MGTRDIKVYIYVCVFYNFRRTPAYDIYMYSATFGEHQHIGVSKQGNIIYNLVETIYTYIHSVTLSSIYILTRLVKNP